MHVLSDSSAVVILLIRILHFDFLIKCLLVFSCTFHTSHIAVPTLAPPVPTPEPVTTTTTPVTMEPVLPATIEGIVYLPAEGAYEVTFDTILINFFVLTSLESATDVFMTRDSNIWVELNAITANHILEHLRFKMDDYDKSLILSVSTNFSSLAIQEPWNNQTILVSETLTGSVIIHDDYGMPRRDSTTNMVKESFVSERSMQIYLASLHVASEPTLHRISNLYLGLPSEVIETTTTITPNELSPDASSQNSDEKDNFVKDLGKNIEWGDWSNTYFVIFVAIVGGVIFMLFSTIILCYCFRRRVRRRQEEKDENLKSKGSDETSNEIASPASNESTENTDNTTLRVIAFSPSKTTPMEDSNSKSSEDAQHLAEAPKPFHPNGRYIVADQSEYDDDIQSDVYSYIDTNTVDDHCYSVAGALMYNPHIPGDDQHSVNWSVAGRTTGVGVGALLNTSVENGDIYQTPQRTNTTQPDTNLSGMLSENSPTNDNVVIFCDSGVEDDSVSLINDSLLQNTTIDHTEHQAEQYMNHGSLMLLPSKHSNKEAMSTNARVAAVVAKLEGKTLLSDSFSSHTTQTERTTNKNSNEEEVRIRGSGSRCEGTEEGDPSSEESVALSSYVAAKPYQSDRQAATTRNTIETKSKPPLASRPQSARQTGKSVRGKSSFFRSTSTGTAESNALRPSNSWEIPTGESTNEKDNKPAASEERKKGFWARTQASRNSKATQLALGNASSPSNDSAPKTAVVTSPTETFVSPVASSPTNNINDNAFLPVQQIKLFEQYEESESDIQSICTFDDDRSYFSFVKTAKGNTRLTDQERNALNNHHGRPPVTSHHNSYIQSMYKKY